MEVIVGGRFLAEGGVERDRVLSVMRVESCGGGADIAVMARHLTRDPCRIKAHLEGSRLAGMRRAATDPFEPFAEYCRRRFE